MSIEKFALFTKDLFDNTIPTVLGRYNFNNNDFNDDLIVVDGLSPAIPISNIDKFDGINEIMQHGSFVRQLATVDFYGNNAFLNATKYMALLRSQKATELKEINNLTVYPANTITDLKELVGTQYFNRYQIEVNIRYMITTEIETLRIDTPNIDLLTEK